MKNVTDEDILEMLLWLNDYCQKVDFEELGLPVNAFQIDCKDNQNMIQIVREFLTK